MPIPERFSRLAPTTDLESEILAFWKEARIFRKSLEMGEGRPRFTFYEGPPTANGTPHNGHVLTRVIKDIVPRYRTMRGYDVPRKAGWDTHGLPVEVEVEKSLGIHGREAIEAYGLEAFSRRCMESVFTYVNEWERLTERIGFWVDMEGAYATFRRSYVESVWWALSCLFSKGLLYQGHKVVWWWPQGGTALSAAEVGLGYKTVDDPSITVRFRLVDDPHTSLLAWTTTPWTLPSNVALAVKPDATYVWLEVGDEVLVVAEALAGPVGGRVLRKAPGRDLVGLRYEPLYRFGTPGPGRLWEVVAAEYVTLDTGTGVVHQAPAFGEEDYQIGLENGLAFLCLVAPDGRFVEGTDFLEGRFCKETDKDILRDLNRRGLLHSATSVRHEYPFCWRSDQDPLIQYARPGWFVRTTALNREALENNAAVRWLPEHIRDGRFGDFLRNNVDWALSRERFWGTPLNIWICDACDHRIAPASAAEIEALAPGALDPEVDPDLQLHRPWIDRVVLPCPRCGGTMHRVPEVIDCWFDAGSMPFAQFGWPHRGHEAFSASFPADFISEAVDQTRGWFYALLMIGTLLFDEETCRRHDLEPRPWPVPFRSCIVLGHVCDADGRKESKSKGNYVPPDLIILGRTRYRLEPDASLTPGEVGLMAAQVQSLDLAAGATIDLSATEDGPRRPFRVRKAEVTVKETLHIHPDDIAALGARDAAWLHAPFDPPGADAFRWLFYASSPPWTNTRISLRAIRDAQREFLLRLRNVHQFFAIYANIAGFDPTVPAPRAAARRHPLDRWILHALAVLEGDVRRALDDLGIFEAARAIQDFTDALSNWYVRRSRARFWGEGPDLEDALYTLYEVLSDLSRVIAPFVPFTAEAFWRSLVTGAGVQAPESVHLSAFPEPDPTLLEPRLAEEMAVVRDLASLGLAARARVGVRVRQPLSAAEVVLADPSWQERIANLVPLLADEWNVREVRFAQDADRFVSFRVKPNFRVLGARLGKDMKACASALAALPGGEVRRRVLSGGLALSLPSGEVLLGEEDVQVEVEPLGHFQAASSASAVVALHTDLDDDLLEEGMAREVVNRIQNLRKSHDLGFTDRIVLGVGGDPVLVAAVRRFWEYVAHETLALRMEEPAAGAEAEDVDGRRLVLSMERA
ncbi:MAG: isoleucine--tRNA ligase [Deltaproteobacteria bacterium]|nr:isoleucine--tRNA ligase [Deltaproteobacteria bacterium]